MANQQDDVAHEWLKSALTFCGLSTSMKTTPPDTVMDRLSESCGNWLILDETLLSDQQVKVLTEENYKLLDSLQYLMNATLNLGQEAGDKTAYTVELCGYREQRYLQLAALADEVAAQVRQSGAAVEMAPLPAAERRLIHTLLGEETDLETFSRGQEPERRLVVEPRPKG